MRKIKKAFTLAEVLTVLAILGVVASIVIPSTVGSFRKKQTEISLLRAYTMLEKAFDMSQAINGPFETWDYVSANKETVGEDFHRKYILPYIIPISYECSYYGNEKKGIKDKTKCFKDNMKTSQNSILSNNARCSIINGCGSANTYRLKNGMSIAFERAYYGFWAGCGLLITVDLDGPDKGKNQIGADIFSFTFKHRSQVAAYKMTPRFETGRLGLNNYTFTKKQVRDNCFGTYNQGGMWEGGLCAKYIEQNGWKIPKDYPIKF